MAERRLLLEAAGIAATGLAIPRKALIKLMIRAFSLTCGIAPYAQNRPAPATFHAYKGL
jgi:hypothetical protein